MKWPARPPDLNPLEHIGDALDRVIASSYNTFGAKKCLMKNYANLHITSRLLFTKNYFSPKANGVLEAFPELSLLTTAPRGTHH
ncbi:hypothetical protein TNIN_469411 [Trichonephila inaurata madagascariensis]|uniref:Uncharacterized protein n=1 Tax=Trichonephila inaurata madagascariensis TaxID=2747483 RepID=A0A8X6XNQ5_9ARAC|nr:hypothetical protein TNIN_469411 [Trichonephila inaurata madagascariensis]